MVIQLTDVEIAMLLQDPKPLPSDFRGRLKTKPKHGHAERELGVVGGSGGEFQLILRQSLLNALDFSVILAYRVPTTGQLFRLRRYNGKSHEHTNPIEGQTFYDFHVHTATERYQDLGMHEDTFAEPTARFADFEGGLRCTLYECAFVVPDDAQASLF